jgi:hypothetical protein
MKLVRLSLLFGIASTFGCFAETPSPTSLPADFKVIIHDYPGMSDWKPFETTITADGTVLQTVFDQEHPKEKRYTIAHHKVVLLFEEVQSSDFFSLPKEYPTEATDCATYVIGVTANGKNREVTFSTCERREASAKRFLRVWAAALKAFPSPNREQKPEDYLR